MNSTAIELKGISKYFGEIVANKNVDLVISKGEILAVLGENGSGKTTLMNMISGIYFPDEGQIFIDGKEALIRSPKDAYDYKIGMIHQHFKLVNVFTAADNIILGEKMPEYSVKAQAALLKQQAAQKRGEQKATFGERISLGLKIAALPFVKLGKKLSFEFLAKDRNKYVQSLADKYGFEINLSKKIYDMSVSEKQTVEIIKVLYRGADILILDEPTAVLTPQETDKLFAVLRNMREDGKAVVIITHKLNEVMAISDKVAVLRKGEHIATVNTSETSEQQLTEMMVGKKVSLSIDREMPSNTVDRLVVDGLTIKNADNLEKVSHVSFTAKAGEILGIAGIAGSGQRELLEAIAGLQTLESGEIAYFEPKTNAKTNLLQKTPKQIRELGVRLSFVPEDRLGMGLVGSMDITDNMMLRSYSKGNSMFLDRKSPETLAEKIIDDLSVVTPGTKTPVRRLSGGNVQKVLVGREIAAVPTVLMAAYPVRGLDINSSYMIYNLLNQQKQKGVAVIYVGEDLDVLIELCDRIMIICGGKITGIVDARQATKEQIGLMMTNSNYVEKSQLTEVNSDGKN